MKSELLKKVLHGFAFGLGVGLALAAVFTVYAIIMMHWQPGGIHPVSAKLLEVHDITLKTTDGPWTVKFLVTNRSEKHVSQFTADVDLLDGSGQFVGDVQKWYSGTLPPGETDGMMVTQADFVQRGGAGPPPRDVAQCRVRIGGAFSRED